MNTQPKISIATIGLEEAHLGILEFLIAYYFKDDFFLTKHNDAGEQVCIFNIKSTDGYKTLTHYKKQNPTVLFVAITKDKIDDETIDSITFPLSPRKISDVLHHIKDKIKTSPALIQVSKKENIPKQTSTVKAIKTKIKIDESYKSPDKVKPYLPLARVEKAPQNISNEPYIKKNKPKQKIDEPQEKASNEPTIKKQNTLKNKADDNKNKQITIKKDILKFVSSRSDINLNNPTIVANLVYPTNKYLQGELTRLYEKAKRDDKITTLDTSYGIISYNPKNHKAFVSVNNTTLQNISSIANLKGKYLLQSANDIIDQNWEDADALLWKASIWASRGRLPAGANIDTLFVLKHWPNLTRFMLTPHAMEISALWVNEPITLRKTISLLAIPQRTVFSFYSAALALNLVTIAPTEIATNIKKEQQPLSKPEKKKRKGFFSKLLNYFKPDNIEEI